MDNMLIPPATLRAAAAMHRPEIKWKLVHKLEAAHHSDRSLQLSKETFIDLVLDTMAASANTQALLGIEADDVRHAAEIVFDTKLALNAPHADSPITVRAAVSHFRLGHSDAAGVPKPIGVPDNAKGAIVHIKNVYAEADLERSLFYKPSRRRIRADAMSKSRSDATLPTLQHGQPSS